MENETNPQFPQPPQWQNDQQRPQPQNQPAGFSQRPVEQPLLRSDVRDRLAGHAPLMAVQPAGGFKGFYRQNKLYFWAGVVGVLLIAALSYFAFFRKTPAAPLQAAKVNISMSAPQSVASGGDEVYQIVITNQDTQKLVNLTLNLVYPDGEVYETSSPNAQDLSGDSFAVPDLAPGQNAAIMLKASVTGNVNDSKDLIAKLTYQYPNSNLQFEKDADFAVRLTSSDLQLALNGPNQANNGQIVQYTVTYQNTASQTIQNGRVTLTYPQGFTFAQATPPPDLGNNTWNINTLASGGQGSIQIAGTFNAGPGQTENAEADFEVLGSDGQYYTQNTAQLATTLTNQPLLVTQTAQDGGNASTTVVSPGDTLEYTIQYENNAQVAANNVNIIVELDSAALDLSSIQAEGGQVNNNTITWNPAAVSALQQLAPNEGGRLNFSVRLNNPAVKDSSTNLQVVSHIKMKSDEYSTYYPGNDLSLKVSSPSTVTAGLAYVSGALPPKVGQNTVYQVTLTLKNSTNNYSNTVVTAFLPQGGFNQSSVSPTEQKNVTFDSSADKLTWNVGQLPAHAGQFTAARTLSFDVTLNPSGSELYQSPTLVKTITLNATDTFTGASVTDTAQDVTTNNLQGQFGGDGNVTQ